MTTVKRFYRNTFTDLEKQHIMDVFLGVFSPLHASHHIWELDSDLHLHNRPPSHLLEPLYPDAFAQQPWVVTRPASSPHAQTPAAGAEAACGEAAGAEGGEPAGSSAAGSVSKGISPRRSRGGRLLEDGVLAESSAEVAAAAVEAAAAAAAATSMDASCAAPSQGGSGGLFDEFYSPASFTSFDELLTRPYLKQQPNRSYCCSCPP